jgi:hypothetical protein
MVLKPRWVVPLNFRSGDKPLLDNVIFLAKKEELRITDIIRDALIEYTRRKLDLCEASGTHRIDEFIASNFKEDSLSGILTREQLKTWQDSDVINFAKMVRARKQELEFELRRRGYHFSW